MEAIKSTEAGESMNLNQVEEIKLEEVIEPASIGFLKNKYFIVAVLAAFAGIAYAITFSIKNIQINFTLYCCSVWFVCLALIFLANYTESSPELIPPT
jgi:hypothetical protein